MMHVVVCFCTIADFAAWLRRIEQEIAMKLARLLLAPALGLMLLNGCATPAANNAAPDGYYRVQQGDTLYRIGQRFGQSVATLSAWNNLTNPNQIRLGQLLRVRGGAATPAASASREKPAAAAATSLRLQWPAEGEIINAFNGTSNKGIDIAGRAGSPVRAAADGRVSYAGEGVRGYGKLILLDHGNNVITAYAHNQSLAVAEGAQVRAGQTIAAMGNTGTDRVKLHFEVRQNGRALNPVSHLPSR